MCSDQRIITEVNDKIQKGVPFTAFSITKECRKNKPNAAAAGTLDHKALKREVHSLFEQGQMQNYLQELVEVPNTNGQQEAFLYYPPGMDIKDDKVIAYVFGNGPEVSIYDNNGSAQATVVAPPALPSPATAPATASAPGVAQTKKASSRPKTTKNSDGSLTKDVGTSKGSALYIPQAMAQQLGVGPNGQAQIAVDQTSGKISIKAGSGDQHHVKTCVDCNGNIRIGKTALMKIGVNGKVKVAMDGQEIVVCPA